MSQSHLPFTERCNPCSSELDGGLEAPAFLQVLSACDEQIFTGFEGEVGLQDGSIIEKIERVAVEAGRVIGSGSGGPVVFTGCGTSGRIAYLVSQRYASVGDMFTYACAGGDSALLLSDEMPEDDPALGRDDLTDVLTRRLKPGSSRQAYVVGVTCGLSAPYVAGQLIAGIASTLNEDANPWNDASLKDVKVGAACVGFNTVAFSREIPLKNVDQISGYDKVSKSCKTFKNVMELLEANSREVSAGGPSHGLINPVIGPEPVTGSSRMKGGSATMVILDVLCLRSLHHSQQLGNQDGNHLSSLSSRSPAELVAEYGRVRESTYSQARSTLPAIMEAAAASMRARVSESSGQQRSGRIVYLGSGSGAALGCIDASEMPDTYGAPFDQTRGFVAGGWGSSGGGLGVHNTEDTAQNPADTVLSQTSRLHRISLECFQEDILPSLSPQDTVVVLIVNSTGGDDEGWHEVLSSVEAVRIRGLGDTLSALVAASSSGAGTPALRPSCQKIVQLVDPARVCTVGVASPHVGHLDFALKLLTNAVTTFAQAKGRGAVFKSLMVTAGPANDKIFMRCVRIISSTVGCTHWQAEKALFASIHNQETWQIDTHTRLLALSREEHIQASILPEDCRDQASFVLPVAILLASNYKAGQVETERRWTVAGAKAALEEEPNISVLLQTSMATSTSTSTSATGVEKGLQFALGIDLGGTNVRAAAIDPTTGTLLTEPAKLRLKEKSGDTVSPLQLRQVLQAVYKEAITMLAMAEAKRRGDVAVNSLRLRPIAVGIGTPGQVDNDQGTITGLANYPEWGQLRLPVREYLSDPANADAPAGQQVPIFIFDDANSALMAETEYGAEETRSQPVVTMLTLGTGVGVGLSLKPHGLRGVVSGFRSLLEGGHAIAHVPILAQAQAQAQSPDALFPLEKCGCGQMACLEVYCSGTGLGKGSERAGVGSTGEDLIAAVKRGSDSAKKQLDYSCMALAAAVLNLRCVYGKEAVVLFAGGLGQTMVPFVAPWLAKLGSGAVTVAEVAEPGIVGAAAGAMSMYRDSQNNPVAPASALVPEVSLRTTQDGLITCSVSLPGTDVAWAGVQECDLMRTVVDMDALHLPSSPSPSAGCLNLLLKEHGHKAEAREALLGAALVNIHRYYDPSKVTISSDIFATAEEARALLDKTSWHIYNDNDAEYTIVQKQ